MSRPFPWLAGALALLSIAAAAFAGRDAGAAGLASRATYLLRAGVVGAGGGPGTWGTSRANGTLGQPQPIGRAAGASVQHAAGFWASALRSALLTGAPEEVPLRNALQQNFPNPFNPATVIAFACAGHERVSLGIYDVRGVRLRTLVREELPPGPHRVVWDGTDDRGAPVAAGVYFCRLCIGDFRAVKKMALVK